MKSKKNHKQMKIDDSALSKIEVLCKNIRILGVKK